MLWCHLCTAVGEDVTFRVRNIQSCIVFTLYFWNKDISLTGLRKKLLRGSIGQDCRWLAKKTWLFPHTYCKKCHCSYQKSMEVMYRVNVFLNTQMYVFSGMCTCMQSFTSAEKRWYLKDVAYIMLVIRRLRFNQIRALECETNPKLSIIYLGMTHGCVCG